MKKVIKSSNDKTRTLIRSAKEDEEETVDETVDETTSTDESAPEPEEGEEDTDDGFDIDEDIVDEINENDDFGGEELAKEDIIDAIKVIDEIATAVTEKEGDGATMDADTVLNKVEEFADDSVADNDMSELDFGEEMPDELANSMVKVMVQDGTQDVNVETTEPTVESIYTDTIEETPATVYDSDMDSSDIELDGDENTETNDDDLLVVGNSKSTSFKKGVIKLNSSLARKNPMNWKKAYKKVTSSLKDTKKVLSSSDWALIQILCQSYNKELSDKIVNVKRVVSSMKKSEKLKSLLQSEIDFENNTQATPSQPFEPNGAPKSECGLGETKGSETGKVDENVGDGQSGEVESTFGDPTVTTKTEEEKKGDFMSDPANTLETLTVPVSNTFQSVVLKKVGKNTYVGCGYVPCKENKVILVKSDKDVLKDCKDNQKITNSLDGKIISFPDGTAILLKSSAIYGLLACRADFVKGIKGSKYEVFKKIGSSYVSPNGIAITHESESEYVIASSTSNKSAKKVESDYEGVFASLEKELHKKELVINSIKAKTEARKQIKSSAVPNAQISRLSSMLRQRDAQIKKLTSLSNSADVKIHEQMMERERENLFASSQKQMSEETTLIKNNAQHNVDFMAKQMSRMF